VIFCRFCVTAASCIWVVATTAPRPTAFPTTLTVWSIARDVQTNLVAVFDAVGHSLRKTKGAENQPETSPKPLLAAMGLTRAGLAA